ncbi:hypothetical protein, partial [Pseudomonas tolaasii]|uniref:hypothetical protein n=1 Tax=Pseudomonas tolaasii TaxID=29442 RepID=UPI001C4328C7
MELKPIRQMNVTTVGNNPAAGGSYHFGRVQERVELLLCLTLSIILVVNELNALNRTQAWYSTLPTLLDGAAQDFLQCIPITAHYLSHLAAYVLSCLNSTHK